MQIITAIVCLGLLVWTGPASAQNAAAQKEYSLTVSVHEDVRPKLTADEVKKILEDASGLLKNNHCDAAFKLQGEVGTFANAPAIIRTSRERDAVHGVNADVKVVVDIEFCKPSLGVSVFNGCAFPFSEGRKSMIVTHARAAPGLLRAILWTHEFGHRTGLQHRADPEAVMTGCSNLFGDQLKINEEECRCYRLGPGGCTKPDPGQVCSDRR
jgi:hypothetical protein